MAIQDEIVNYLRRHPNKKAREIATAIGAERSEVNSVLFRGQRNVFRKTADHRWELVDGHLEAAMRRDASSPGAIPDTDLAKLCRFYLACIGKDAERDISEFASSRYDLKYAELSVLPFLTPNAIDGWNSACVSRILGRYRQDRRQLALFVGYPTRLVHIHSSRSNWEGFRVEPLFTYEYRLEGHGGAPELVDERPEVNLKVLRALTGVDGQEVFDESLHLQADLGLDGASLSPDDLLDVFAALPEVRPDWPWREPIRPAALMGEPSLSTIEQAGIYNRAILLTAERSPYTRGLETELAELQQVSPIRYQDTALGGWLSSAETKRETKADGPPLLEVLPLNTEQREAVRRSLSEPLSVITGPPGTGKSQVVTSILVNCAHRAQKVLFASKNNKAVDVVEMRVNALGPRPLLLRLGSNEHRTKLAEYLSAFLATTTDAHDHEQYEQAEKTYEQALAQREQLQKQLNQVVELRNRVDDRDKAIEAARRELGPELFRASAAVKLDGARAELTKTASAVQAANRAQQSLLVRLLWFFLAPTRVERANEAMATLAVAVRPLGLNPPAPLIGSDEIGQFQNFVSQVEQRVSQAEAIRDYFAALQHLKKVPSPEDIAHQSLQFETSAAGISEELWRLWLRIQPSRLTPEERRLLGDYKASLELLIRADSDDSRPPGGVFRQLAKLFSRLTASLPAWAVTNLSARGRLPLEPALFDLLVIDEASQCDIASALPLLFRCRRAVIIGDPKQLKHITQLPSHLERQFMEQHGVLPLGARWSYTANSLFDLAATLAGGDDIVHLRDHHRSHADIIGFSNKEFYEGRLRIATRYDRLRFPSKEGPAVRWINVVGQVRRPATGGAVNELEARGVVDELERLLVQQRYTGTVGVVSPFRAQVNRINDLVSQHDRLRSSLGGSELLIDTVHKFQGDERDVILFSPVVSVDAPATAVGFLKSNQNTFNVAITRARAALVVVGDHAACARCAANHLAGFARYAVQERRGGVPEGDEIDYGPKYPAVAKPEKVSEWERWFYEVLYHYGLRPTPQYPVEQYDLDFAFLARKRRLDVEIDGEHYHRTWNGELALRDQIRNRRMIELGWDVMRFWVYEIRDDTDTCVQRILKWNALHNEKVS